ncbi:MAG: hypothetical protein PHS42_04770 [Sulfurimonas sp.]|nr:hypothetical protein [Sulfurimonas sp.]MDD3834770.1 hypothetical protein [Sulfurimonas sp.]
MKIKTAQSRIIITQNIKSIADFQAIKLAVDSAIEDSRYLTIEILDSISITSSVIGYFNMLVHTKNIDLHLHVNNPKLIALLEDLSLVKAFNAKQV